MKKYILIILASLILCFGIANAEEPENGDTIIYATIGDASTLLPPLPMDGASWTIIGQVYSGLLKNEKNLKKKIGVLAESWDISDDYKTITFYLRKGVKWHDGVEFTAEDVLFTYQVLVDPKTPTVYGGDFQLVEKAEVLDKYTFRVTYKEAFAPALDAWGISIIPKHLLEGKDITKSKLARNPIGTGPYKFVEWTTGQRIVLKANDEYFEGRPYIDRIIYKVIPDPATMFLELKSGSVDEIALTSIQFKRQTNDEAFLREFNKITFPTISGYTYMGFNLEDPRFKDKRVRKALAFAISKEDIVKGVLLGLGKPATGPYVPDKRLWYYNPNVKTYDLNSEKERILNELRSLKGKSEQEILNRIEELENEYGMTFDYMYSREEEKKSILSRIVKELFALFFTTSTQDMGYGPEHSIKELFFKALREENIEEAAKQIIREMERQKARILLAEAGWTDSDGDGLLDKEGQIFEFTLMTNQGNQARELTALIIQQELAKIGIKEKIKIVEWSAFINEFIDKGKFESILLGWGLGTDPDQYDIWHSSKIFIKSPEGEIIKRGLNFVGYANPEIDKLLDKGRKTLNRAERKKIYDRFQELLAEDQPYVFLYVGDATIAIHKRIKGIDPALTGIGHNSTWWYVPKAEQMHITP